MFTCDCAKCGKKTRIGAGSDLSRMAKKYCASCWKEHEEEKNNDPRNPLTGDPGRRFSEAHDPVCDAAVIEVPGHPTLFENGACILSRGGDKCRISKISCRFGLTDIYVPRCCPLKKGSVTISLTRHTQD